MKDVKSKTPSFKAMQRENLRQMRAERIDRIQASVDKALAKKPARTKKIK